MSPIVILNGAPRSGKSSIARAVQACSAEPWMNLGVDAWMAMSPERLRPALGLRPGGERPDLEPLVRRQLVALLESARVHAELGLPVLVDVGLHDAYSRPLGLWQEVIARLPSAWLVGVRCPLGVILDRRRESGMTPPDVEFRARAWDDAVHAHGVYDLELDTGELTAEACAAEVLALLKGEPHALRRLAAQLDH